jgi:sentrin-specific protease 1
VSSFGTQNSQSLPFQIVNMYYNLVAARSVSDGKMKVHVFNSFFYSKLVQTGYGGVRRWTKKVLVLVGDHFYLL